MRSAAVAVALAAALLAPACSTIGASPEIAHHTPAVSPGEKSYAEGVAALRDGNHERAIDLFAQSWKEEPDNPDVSRDFVAALEALKKSGDEAARQDQPDDAAKKWAAVLRNAGHPAAKGKSLSFSRADLKGNLDRLTASRMEMGLKEYRTGNLDAAIGIWRSILAYDPGNAEAAKAIRTTTTQLENLKKVSPAK